MLVKKTGWDLNGILVELRPMPGKGYKMKKIMSLILSLIIVITVVFTSSYYSYAFVPEIALEGANALALALSEACGTTITTAQSAQTLAAAVYDNMTAEDGAEFEEIYDDWTYNDKITVSETFLNKWDTYLQSVMSSNQIISNMLSKDIVKYETEQSKEVMFLSANSSIPATSTNLIPYLNFYTVPNTGTSSALRITDDLGIYNYTFQQNGVWKKSAYYCTTNSDGSVNTALNVGGINSTNQLLSTSIEVAIIVTDSSYIYFWYKLTPVSGSSTYAYYSGSIVKTNSMG